VLSLRKPSAEKLRGFLAAQSKLGLTYPAVGATAAVPPGGYVVDRTRIRLGGGARTFAAAKAALGRWEQFRLGWVEAWPPVMGQMFVLDAGLGTYFEGFAHSITIPFHHAWVVIDGRPLDFTIEAADRRL
jgi:hypothetical protein